jgi:hypothetical protein
MEDLDNIIIGITSKQWGPCADSGWCTTYQGDNHQDLLGSGTSSVMTTLSYNDRTRADLHTIQAARIFLQMQLQPVWEKKSSIFASSQTTKPL